MNKKIKQKLINCLKSDQYKQGFEALAVKIGDEYHYCIMGVLCELAVEEGILYKKENGQKYMYSNTKRPEDYSAYTLPNIVKEWSGLNYSIIWDLVHKNDKQVSFHELAEYIEQKV